MTRVILATERWHIKEQMEVEDWLKATYGPPSPDTWQIHIDWATTDLVMTEEIYTLYLIKWRKYEPTTH